MTSGPLHYAAAELGMRSTLSGSASRLAEPSNAMLEAATKASCPLRFAETSGSS